MKTIYLVDYENINNDERLKNIVSLPETDQVYIFFTKDTPKINTKYAFSEKVTGHEVLKVKKAKNSKKEETDDQALDKHLVSYLGYLLGKYEKKYAYVIVSEDTGYDNIIKFWKDKGYLNISRKKEIPGTPKTQKTQKTQKTAQSVVVKTTQTTNSKISEGRAYYFSGDDRTKLNQYMQRKLADAGYSKKDVNKICKCIIAHCNDEIIFKGIREDLNEIYTNGTEVCKYVETIFEDFNPRE